MIKKIIVSGLMQILSDFIRRRLDKSDAKEAKLAEASAAAAPARPRITLTREYADDAVFGIMSLPNTPFEVRTVERPWRNNAPNISCIPEGEYVLRKRPSAVVARTSGGEFDEGWEVCDVKDRTYIMIHVGNTVDDVEGCIAVGEKFGVLGSRRAVLNSRRTFRALMEAMKEEEYTLVIKRGEAHE